VVLNSVDAFAGFWSKYEVGWCRLKPVGTRVESAWFKQLKPKCDKVLSSLAFNFNLRRYNQGGDAAIQGLVDQCLPMIEIKLVVQDGDATYDPPLDQVRDVMLAGPFFSYRPSNRPIHTTS
jgi:hypothetical protein